MDKAERAKAEVLSAIMQNAEVRDSNIFPMACDQSSIQSVKSFASQLREQYVVNGRSIDVLCLNAATLHNCNEPEYTEDGLEKTFATNHLANHIIVSLIHDLIRPQGRVVVTGSGLHYDCTFGDFCGMVDPETGLARKAFPTINGSDFQLKSAYAASKLCNVAFTIALNRRLRQRGDRIVANCFTPGLIPESGLFRNEGSVRRMLFSSFMKLSNMSSTIEWGGGALAWMAVADEAGRHGGEYWKTPMGSSHTNTTYGKEFSAVPPSDEALSETNQDKLWELSSQLAGLPSDIL